LLASVKITTRRILKNDSLYTIDLPGKNLIFDFMKGEEINSAIVSSYLRLLENLNPASKQELIAGLSRSLKADLSKSKERFIMAFGAWKSEKSAELLIDEIQVSRSFGRKNEEM
jgi:hypothetical protein